MLDIPEDYTNDIVAARFDSPHIMRIYLGFSRRLSNRGMVQWIATEYLDIGVDTVIAMGFDGTDEIRRIGFSVLTGLAEAHSKGYLHRDTHPYNIMGRQGSNGKITVYKIIDFGRAERIESPIIGLADLRKESPIIGLADLRKETEVILYAISAHLESLCNKPGARPYYMVGDVSFKTMRVVGGYESMVDFFYLMQGDCERPPKSVYDLLEHAFITGEKLDVATDKFGKRLYRIEGDD